MRFRNKLLFDHWEDDKGNRVNPKLETENRDAFQHEGDKLKQQLGVKRLIPCYTK